MGLALWKRAAPEPVGVAPPPYFPPAEQGCRYRIEVCGAPRAPWRASPAEAMADAIRLDLSSWDEDRREHYLAVPVDMRVHDPKGG